MKSFRVKSLVGALAAVFCGAAVSQAAMVDYKIGNGGLAQYTMSLTDHNGGDPFSAYAGAILLKNPTTDAIVSTTVCTDILGTLLLNKTYSFDIEAFGGQSGIDPAWGNPANPANAAAAIQNAAWLFNNVGASSQPEWQALQLAVWEALYDTGSGTLSLNDGRFQVTGGDTTVRGLAAGYLGSIPNTLGVMYTGFLLKPNEPVQHDYKAQALLITGPSTPVPEPSTIIAGLLLLVPLGMGTAKLLRRRINA